MHLLNIGNNVFVWNLFWNVNKVCCSEARYKLRRNKATSSLDNHFQITSSLTNSAEIMKWRNMYEISLQGLIKIKEIAVRVIIVIEWVSQSLDDYQCSFVARLLETFHSIHLNWKFSTTRNIPRILAKSTSISWKETLKCFLRLCAEVCRNTAGQSETRAHKSSPYWIKFPHNEMICISSFNRQSSAMQWGIKSLKFHFNNGSKPISFLRQ